jgi:hypothetical protein
VYTTAVRVSGNCSFQLTSRGSYEKEGDIYAAVVMFHKVLLSSYPTEFVIHSHPKGNMMKVLETRVN